MSENPDPVLLLAVFDAPNVDDSVMGQAWQSPLQGLASEDAVSEIRLSTTVRGRADTEGIPTHLIEVQVNSLDVVSAAEHTLSRAWSEISEKLDIAEKTLDLRQYRFKNIWVNEDYSPEASTHLVAVWMTVSDIENLDRWYADEHVRLLFDVPGWLRCRRYDLVDGAGPKTLALHELAAEETVDHPAAAPARNTPWRDQILADASEGEYPFYRILARW